jgi:fructokinase
MTSPLYGAIEAGGTKFVCAVGTGPGALVAQTRFATRGPAETLQQAVDFFAAQQAEHGRLAAVGIGCFGPVDPRPGSPTYGFITSTPKPGWANTDVVGPIRRTLGVQVAFDTDVNAAALGEWRWGAARGARNCLYLTVGTGIGGGVLVAGRPLHGLVHPELGHIPLPHDRAADPFAGCCPFHGDCLEGLASGPAMRARWGQPAETLPPDHPGWALEAHYLALALASFVCTLSPERVVLGGGVMQQAQLFPLIRAGVRAGLNGYVRSPALEPGPAGLDVYLVPPGLGQQAGVLGALALAMALSEPPEPAQ